MQIENNLFIDVKMQVQLNRSAICGISKGVICVIIHPAPNNHMNNRMRVAEKYDYQVSKLLVRVRVTKR